MEFNETWHDARSQRPLPSLCFSGQSEKQDGPSSLWLAKTFSTSSLKPMNRIQWNLTGSKISTSSTKFVFFGPVGKKRWPSWPLIGCDIFDFSDETAERKSTKFDRKQDDNVLYQVCVFGPIWTTRWPPWSLIGWDIFDLFSENAERNSTKLDTMQDDNVLYQVCGFFLADLKNKMAALASDRLRHFRLLLWNRWTEFNETWQEARSKRLLPSLCYWGRSQKQDGRPDLWLAETFSTSSLKSLNGIQRNLTRSKLLTSSTKFLFFGPVGKKRWPPWPLVGWDIFDFFAKTAERNSTKLDGKEDLNVLYQVCVFWADRKNKMAALASDWLRHFRLLLWNRWTEFNETWQEARSQRLLPSLCFWADWKNKMAAPASDWLRHFQLLIWNRWTEFDEAWQEARSQRPLPILCFSGRSVKKRLPPWPMIGWDIFDFSCETAERDSKKFDRKQDLNIFYQVVFFSLMSK